MMTEAGLPVTYEDAVGYLERNGWTRQGGGDFADLWHAAEQPEVRVLVPKLTEAVDYRRRLSELFQDLACYERKLADQVTDEMARQYADVVYLRAANGGSIGDTIPAATGLELFNTARKIVVASAAATIVRQPSFAQTTPKRAYRHAHEVKLGHTQRGSYVLPIISRADSLSEIQHEGETPLFSIAGEEAQFGRRVQVTMAKALSVLEHLTVTQERLPTPAQSIEAVGVGLSSDLAEAVTRVLRADSVGEVDLRFKWSIAGGTPLDTPDEVSFPRDAVDKLEVVVEQLKASSEPHRTVVFGSVVELRSGPHEDGGRVEVEAVLNGKRRNIVMRLNARDYEIARQSHTQTRVIAQGVLTNLGPRRTPTMDVTSFDFERTLTSVNINSSR